MFQFFATAIKTIEIGCCARDKRDSQRMRESAINRNSDEYIKSPGHFMANDGSGNITPPPNMTGSLGLANNMTGSLGLANNNNNNNSHCFSYGSDEKVEIFQHEPLPIIANLSLSDQYAPMRLHTFENIPQQNQQYQFQEIKTPNIDEQQHAEVIQNNGLQNHVAGLNLSYKSSQKSYREFLQNKNQDSCSETDSKGSGKVKRNMKLWTPEEDRLLAMLHKEHNGHWNDIIKNMPGRNMSQCSQRWRRIRPQKQRQPWQKQEDDLVIRMVMEQKQNWGEIASQLEGRSGKQIRERFINKLDPSIQTGRWSMDEDHKIIEMYNKIGSKWSQISKLLVGRPQNMVKNRFYSHIKKIMQLQDGNDAVKGSPKREYNSSYEESDNTESDTSSKRGEYLSDDHIQSQFIKIEENLNFYNQNSGSYSPEHLNQPTRGTGVSLTSGSHHNQPHSSGIRGTGDYNGNYQSQISNQPLHPSALQTNQHYDSLYNSRNNNDTQPIFNAGYNPQLGNYGLQNQNGGPAQNYESNLNNNNNIYSNGDKRDSFATKKQNTYYMTGNLRQSQGLSGPQFNNDQQQLKSSIYSTYSAPANPNMIINGAGGRYSQNYNNIGFDSISQNSDNYNTPYQMGLVTSAPSSDIYPNMNLQNDPKLDSLQQTQQELMNKLMGIQQEIIKQTQRTSIKGTNVSSAY